MSKLKNQLLRLAKNNPSLRKDVLPLVEALNRTSSYNKTSNLSADTTRTIADVLGMQGVKIKEIKTKVCLISLNVKVEIEAFYNPPSPAPGAPRDQIHKNIKDVLDQKLAPDHIRVFDSGDDLTLTLQYYI